MTNRLDKNKKCHLCGKNDWKKIYQSHPRKNHSAASARHKITIDHYGDFGLILKCRACGLVCRDFQESQQELLSAYADMKDDTYMEEQDCRSINAHLSLRVIKKHKTQGRLLEVGCAVGFFLNAARTHFDVYGVEPSLWAAQFAKEKLKLDVGIGDIQDASFANEFFDVACLVDVIEHLPDPKGAIARIHQFLKPNGLLYLVTPDIRSLAARALGRRWWGLRPAHLYYFSYHTLKKMLEENGFTVVSCSSYGRVFTLGYWLSRIKSYPSLVYQTIRFFIRLLGVQDKVFYLNTRDSIELCAVKGLPDIRLRSENLAAPS